MRHKRAARTGARALAARVSSVSAEDFLPAPRTGRTRSQADVDCHASVYRPEAAPGVHGDARDPRDIGSPAAPHLQLVRCPPYDAYGVSAVQKVVFSSPREMTIIGSPSAKPSRCR